VFEAMSFLNDTEACEAFFSISSKGSADTELYVVLTNSCDLRSKVELNNKGCLAVLEFWSYVPRIIVSLWNWPVHFCPWRDCWMVGLSEKDEEGFRFWERLVGTRLTCGGSFGHVLGLAEDDGGEE
jgi:hypothetical protein